MSSNPAHICAMGSHWHVSPPPTTPYSSYHTVHVNKCLRFVCMTLIPLQVMQTHVRVVTQGQFPVDKG